MLVGKPEKSDQIRALDRGLQVIEHLSRNGAMTLADLRRATGLSNPTLLRVLATLQARNWARRNIVEGHFELTHSLNHLLGMNARAHPLAEFSASVLLGLKTLKLGWPSDVCAVLEPGRIEILESTRIRGPMAPTRTGLGLRPSMVFSAHGRATLAFSPAEITRAHLSAIMSRGDKEDRLWITDGRLNAEILATKRRGYGLRQKHYWAPGSDPELEVGAVAMPIFSDSNVHGTISLLWLEDESSLDDIRGSGGLDELRRASVEIGAALDRANVVTPRVSARSWRCQT